MCLIPNPADLPSVPLHHSEGVEEGEGEDKEERENRLSRTCASSDHHYGGGRITRFRSACEGSRSPGPCATHSLAETTGGISDNYKYTGTTNNNLVLAVVRCVWLQGSTHTFTFVHTHTHTHTHTQTKLDKWLALPSVQLGA